MNHASDTPPRPQTMDAAQYVQVDVTGDLIVSRLGDALRALTRETNRPGAVPCAARLRLSGREEIERPDRLARVIREDADASLRECAWVVSVAPIGPRRHRLVATISHQETDRESMERWVRQLAVSYAQVGDQPAQLTASRVQAETEADADAETGASADRRASAHANRDVDVDAGASLSVGMSERPSAEGYTGTGAQAVGNTDERLAADSRWIDLLPRMLPIERRVTQPTAFSAGRVSFSLDFETVVAIQECANRADCTVDACLLAVWQLLVWRLLDRSPFSMGVAIDDGPSVAATGASARAARASGAQAALARAPRVRAVPFICEPDASMRVGELLASWSDALDRSHGSSSTFLWPDAARAAGCEGFPILFETRPLPGTIRAGGLSWRIAEISDCRTDYRLRCCCESGQDLIRVSVRHDAGLIDARDVAALCRQFTELARELPASFVCPVGEISVRDGEVRAPRIPIRPHELPPVEESFVEQARDTPDRPALVAPDGTRTYGELLADATAIATRLRALGVGPDRIVGLLVEPSVWTISALWGVLLAGGAYAPIDRETPPAYRARQLAASRVDLLLATREACREALDEVRDGDLGAVDFGTVDFGAAGSGLVDAGPGAAGPGESSGGESRVGDSGAGDSGGREPAANAVRWLAIEDLVQPDHAGVDSDWSTAAREPWAWQPRPDSALAYVIHTSGSTGTPKAVGVPRGALANYTDAICQSFGFADARRPFSFVLAYSLAADLGNTCLFPALTSGGCLHVLAKATAIDGAAFADYMTRHTIDVLKVVPSHLRALLSHGSRVLPRTWLISGGEPFHAELFDRVKAAGARCQIVNHYGPTEATVGCLLQRVERGDELLPAILPVGHPLAHDEAYVLDETMRPVGVNMPGELWVGGAGLARGYLNAPAQTAERFRPHPFPSRPGQRLYRTGDIARRRHGGRVQVLGRGDDQVKIRGYRIELAEIEAAIAQHPAVAGAALMVVREASGVARLTAYLERQAGIHVTDEQLQAYLRRQVPPAMQPSELVWLERLPVKANGKADKKQLARIAAETAATASAAASTVAPATASSDASSASTAFAASAGRQSQTPGSRAVAAVDRAAGDTPIAGQSAAAGTAQSGAGAADAGLSELEASLIATWKDVLQRDDVRRDDNFFELGGDSILAIQLAAALRQAGFTLTPIELFRSPTVARLAAAIRPVETTPRVTPPVAAPPPAPSPVVRGEAYPLTPLQQGMLFHCLSAPGERLYVSEVRTTYGSDFDPDAYLRAWEQMLDRHTIFRTAFRWDDQGDPVQVVLPRVALIVDRQDWSGLTPEDARERLDRYCAEAHDRGIDLETAPLMRMALIALPAGRHHTVWHYHHLIMDGWSHTILRDELSESYDAARQGRDHPRPRPAPYRDYVDWLQRQDVAAAEAFWRRYLRGFGEPTAVPGRMAKAEAAAQETPATWDAIEENISVGESDALRTLSRREQVTLSTVVQGAWALVLAEYGGEPDVLFGVTMVVRPPDMPALNGTIGLFLNTLPLRVRVDVDAPVRDWLRELQQSQAEAREHGHTPLVQVQAWSGVARGRGLFDTFIGFHNPSLIRRDPRAPVVSPLRTEGRSFRGGWTNYPMSVDIESYAEEIVLGLNVDTRLLTPAASRQVLATLRSALALIAAQPADPVGTLRRALAKTRRDRLTTVAPAFGRRPKGPVGAPQSS